MFLVLRNEIAMFEAWGSPVVSDREIAPGV
jgi:hypothetical protein